MSRVKRGLEIIRIEQQEKLIRTKRDLVTWNDPKYPEMWYLVSQIVILIFTLEYSQVIQSYSSTRIEQP